MTLKRGWIGLLMLLTVSIAQAQINENEIVFESESYNFGRVPFGKSIINATFIFTNTSEHEFVIREVRASCGCTVPSWPDVPIAPGEKGVITATFDPSNLAGEVDKSIEIFANYNVIMSKLIHIRGIIEEPVEADYSKHYPGQFGYILQSKNTLGFGEILNTKTYSQQVVFINEYNLPLKFTGVKQKPDYCSYSFTNEVIEPGDTVTLTVTIDGSKVGDFGLVNDNLVLESNDRFFPLKAIKLAFFVKEDFSKLSKRERRKGPKLQISKQVFDFGTVKEGSLSSATVELTNTGKTPLTIYKVETSCGCTTINLNEQVIAPGETQKARVTFDSMYITGNAEKEVLFYTNDPNNHEVKLLVTANVLQN